MNSKKKRKKKKYGIGEHISDATTNSHIFRTDVEFSANRKSLYEKSMYLKENITRLVIIILLQ